MPLSRTFSGALALAATAISSAVPASEPTPRLPCGPHDEVVAHLGAYDERQVAMGLTVQGALLEIFVAASGSWSIVVTRPDGAACIVAIGDAWLSTLAPDRPGA